MRKKLPILLIITIASIGASISGVYWYRIKTTPPETIPFKNIEELNGEIAKLEDARAKWGLSWQDSYRLGVGYLHVRRFRDSIKALEEARLKNPAFDKTHESLGMAYYRLNEFEKAIASWEDSLRMNPSLKHLEDMIGMVKKKVEIKKRISAIEGESKKGEIGWQKRYELALLYVGTNRLDDAIKELVEIEKAKKDSPDIYDAIAEAYAMKGDFGKSIFYEKKALLLSPGDERLKKRLSEMERLRDSIKRRGNHKGTSK